MALHNPGGLKSETNEKTWEEIFIKLEESTSNRYHRGGSFAIESHGI